MKPVLVLLMIVLASPASAQGGRRDSGGGDARTDSMLGTPNKATPAPQANQFSTSPGLEQQAPGPQGKTPTPSPAAPATDKPR